HQRLQPLACADFVELVYGRHQHDRHVVGKHHFAADPRPCDGAMVPEDASGALNVREENFMRRWLPLFLVLAAVSLGCDNSSSSRGPTTPTVPLTSQTFTGTGAPGGSSSNTTFVVATSGEVDLPISSLGPPANIIMGLAIGIPSTTDSSCAAPASAGQNVQA